jgi:hypothetical protein
VTTTHGRVPVRAIWLETDPDRLDSAIEVYKSQSLPGMERLEGFCSASLMIDRTSGRCVSCVTFDSVDAMERNPEQGYVPAGEDYAASRHRGGRRL